MADSVNRRISIYIDSVQAEVQLGKLLEREKALVRTNSEIKQGSAAWKANEIEIAKLNKQIAQYQDQLSGKVGPTMAQLKKQQAQLNAELAKMPVELRKGSDEWKKLQGVNSMIKSVGDTTNTTAKSWQSFMSQVKAGFFGVLGGNIATAALGGSVDYVRQGIANAAKVSDQLSDIRKTTGLTTQEVDTLNKSLGSIDTRTATSELREMAIVAGQFGIQKDQILGFVKAVDLVNVALGDEFKGGSEAIATEMSKLRNVFTDVKSDNIAVDIEHIANALNELGAAGVATGPVVADFANRIGGVGIQLGLTTAQVLGLSATLQELNVSTERGGTAVGKILQKMAANVQDFYEVAKPALDPKNNSLKAFTDMVNNDLYGAFTKVAKGSQMTGTNATALAAILDDLNLEGAGASEVFAKVGSNISLLDEKVLLANKSLATNTSITEENAIKQDNLAGSLERADKAWAKIGNSSGMKKFAQLWADLKADFATTIDSFLNFTWEGTAARAEADQKKANERMIEEKERALKEKAELEFQYNLKIKQLNNAQLQEELKTQKGLLALYNQGLIEAAKSKDKALFDGQVRLINETRSNINAITSIVKTGGEKQEATISEAERKRLEKQKEKHEKLLESFRDYERDVELIAQEAKAAAESKNDEELEKVVIKYAKLRDKAKDHFEKLPELAEEYYRIIRSLNEAEFNDKTAVLDKQIVKAEESYNKDLASFLKAEREKTEALKTETDKRIQAEYSNLIGSARAGLINGQTDGSLSPEEQLDKKKQILLLEMEAQLENDKLTAGQKKEIWAQYYADLKDLDDQYLDQQLKNIFEFADQFSAMAANMATIQDNKNTELMQQETRIAKKQQADLEKRKKAELAALESKNKEGLLKTDSYNEAKTAIEEKYSIEQQKINDDLELKKIEADRQSVQRQKSLGIFGAIINTAQAIIKMLVDPGGVAGIALSIGAGITGATQIAAIQSTPIPQFNWGGSTMNVVGSNTGRNYQAKNIGSFKGGGRYTNASYGLIGEEGAELVLPNWLYTHPRMFNTMRMLEYSINQGQAFASGGATSTTSAPVFQNNTPITTDPKLIQLLQQQNMLMQALYLKLQEPFIGFMSYDQQKDSNLRVQQIINNAGNA